MSDDDETHAHDPLSISYVAVMCCGLAGALVLFLVFAVMPHSGSITVQGHVEKPSSGRDKEQRQRGARLIEMNNEGMQDVVSASVEMDKGTWNAESLEWTDGFTGGRELTDKQTTICRIQPSDREVIQFHSPAIERRRQRKPIQFALHNTSTKTIETRITVRIIAGGFMQHKELEIKLAPGATYSLPEPIDVNQINWFDRAATQPSI